MVLVVGTLGAARDAGIKSARKWFEQ